VCPESNKNELVVMENNDEKESFPKIYFYEKDNFIDPCDIPSQFLLY